jgi:hypothetical protein
MMAAIKAGKLWVVKAIVTSISEKLLVPDKGSSSTPKAVLDSDISSEVLNRLQERDLMGNNALWCALRAALIEGDGATISKRHLEIVEYLIKEAPYLLKTTGTILAKDQQVMPEERKKNLRVRVVLKFSKSEFYNIGDILFVTDPDGPSKGTSDAFYFEKIDKHKEEHTTDNVATTNQDNKEKQIKKAPKDGKGEHGNKTHAQWSEVVMENPITWNVAQVILL